MKIAWDGIIFDLLKLDAWVREAVYTEDKTTFLWWHHLIDCTCMVNEVATASGHFPPLRLFRNRAGEVDNFPPISPQQFRRSDVQQPNTSTGSDLGFHLGLHPGLGTERSTGAQGRPIPNRAANSSTAPWTSAELMRRLRMPRRQLLIWVHTGRLGEAEFLLASPLTGAGSDALHGPTCTVTGIPQIHGNSTAVMNLRFETWEAPIDPAIFNTGPGELRADSSKMNVALKDVSNRAQNLMMLERTPALLSNRWSMEMKPDPDTYLAVIAITGEAIFRMDVLRARKLTAHQLARQFMHPIAAGYIRRPPNVKVSPGGDAVEYTIADFQQMTNFPGGAKYGVIHCDVQQTVEVHTPLGVVSGGGGDHSRDRWSVPNPSDRWSTPSPNI